MKLKNIKVGMRVVNKYTGQVYTVESIEGGDVVTETGCFMFHHMDTTKGLN